MNETSISQSTRRQLVFLEEISTLSDGIQFVQTPNRRCSVINILSLDTQRKLHANAQKVFQTVLTVLGEKAQGKTGAKLRIYYAVDRTAYVKGWREIYSETLGHLDEDAAERCLLVSGHKATSLMNAHSFSLTDKGPRQKIVSSWQIRNFDRAEYGGAIIVKGFVTDPGELVPILLSTSGLPEHGDEAVDLLMAKSMIWGNAHDYRTIMDYSDNDIARDLP